MPKTNEEVLAELDRNELLWKAIDRAILGGRMVVGAGQDCYDLYHDKCTIFPDTQQVMLNGKELDAALTEIISKRPLWAPSGPDPRVVAQQELEAAALAGNVSAHGKLFKIMGQTAYDAWRAKHAVKPGQAAVAATDNTNTDVDPKNPFVGFRDAATGKVDPAKSAIVAALIKSAGIAAVTKLAKAAGTTLGGYPLRKAG